MLKKYIKKALVVYYDFLCKIPSFQLLKRQETLSDLENKGMNKLGKDGYIYSRPFQNKLKLKDTDTYDCSLLIPVYNAKDFLEQCLDSLVNQDTKYKYEIVVVNDGSTDGTDELLHTYENMDNVTVYKQKNGGISVARNKALELATGRYVGFIDNDDYVSSTYVEKLMTEATTADADVVKCGYTIFNETGILGYRVGQAFSSKNGFGTELMKYDGLIWGGGCTVASYLGVSPFQKNTGMRIW